MAYLIYTFYPDVPPLVQSWRGWGLGWRFCSEVAWLYMYKLQVSVALQSFRLRPVHLRARSFRRKLLSTHSLHAVTKTVHNKKMVTTPGSQLAKCHHCNRSMLVKNCYFDMTVSSSLEKDGKQFLNADIFSFKDNTDPLKTKLTTGRS